MRRRPFPSLFFSVCLSLRTFSGKTGLRVFPAMRSSEVPRHQDRVPDASTPVFSDEDDSADSFGDAERERDVEDFEPLLESHELDVDKVKDEIVRELSSAGVMTTYDRKS